LLKAYIFVTLSVFAVKVCKELGAGMHAYETFKHYINRDGSVHVPIIIDLKYSVQVCNETVLMEGFAAHISPLIDSVARAKLVCRNKRAILAGALLLGSLAVAVWNGISNDNVKEMAHQNRIKTIDISKHVVRDVEGIRQELMYVNKRVDSAYLMVERDLCDSSHRIMSRLVELDHKVTFSAFMCAAT
jgi:hypothetical protein